VFQLGLHRQPVHEDVKESLGLGVLSGSAGDREDTDKAGGDVLGADIVAEHASRAAGVEDGGDRRKEFVA
jgi:hypothetical protein